MVLTGFKRGAAVMWTRAARRTRGADWYAVTAEIVMIVLGILIAFQLDRWAEGWRKVRDRELYLERLIEESATNVEVLTQSLQLFRRNTAELRQILAFLADRAARPRPAGRGFGCRMLHMPAVRLQTTAMAESANAGALDLIPDAPLRGLIHRAAAGDAFTAGQLDYFRGFFLRYSERTDRHLAYRFDPRAGVVSCALALDSLAGDPDAPSALARVYADRVNFAGFRARQLGEHRAVNARARCLLAGNCPAAAARGSGRERRR